MSTGPPPSSPVASQLPTREGLARAAERATPAFLVLAALLLLAKWLFGLHGEFGFDFHGTIWQATRDVFHGRSPYPRPVAHELLLKNDPAVYPPAIFLLATPLGFVPLTIATALWDVVMAGCLAAAFRLVGVRDRRIYAVVFLSLPFTASMVLGQIDGLLALGCALAWRYRDRLLAPGLAVAGLVATKLFLWPLAVWLVLTGRRRPAAVSVLATAAVLLGAWATIGFAGLRQYPRLLMADSDAFQNRGYSPVATALRLGLSIPAARVAAPLVVVGLLVLVYRFARRGSDERAFAAAVAAGVFGTPIVWMHSMLIVLVGFAVVQRRFGAAWLVPLAFWLSPTEPPHLREFVIAQCLMLIVVARALSVSAAGPRLAP